MTENPTATPAAAEAPVVYTASNGVAHIELNRPQAFNALSVELAVALGAAVQQAADDDAVKVVLLTGRGRAFCAGGDVKEMSAADETPVMVGKLADLAHQAILALAQLDKPVVAAVHGSVAGGGLGLSCAADLLLAGESTKFVAAYAGIAVSPDCSVSWALPRIIGERRALQMTLLNQPISAQTAEQWGLATALHPDDEVLDAGRALAEALAANPAAAALGHTRRLIRDGASRTLADQLDVEAAGITHFVAQPEAIALVDRFAGR